MVKEPVDMTLRLLQDIRAAQDKQGVVLEQQRSELARLNRSIDDWKETTATAAGLAFHANVKTDSVDRRIDELAERIERLEKKK